MRARIAALPAERRLQLAARYQEAAREHSPRFSSVCTDLESCACLSGGCSWQRATRRRHMAGDLNCTLEPVVSSLRLSDDNRALLACCVPLLQFAESSCTLLL